MDKDDLTKEDIEALKTVANSDLQASWIAQRLCESFNIDTSQTTYNDGKTPESLTDTPETKESVFAF
jgi:hypothetical protein